MEPLKTKLTEKYEKGRFQPLSKEDTKTLVHLILAENAANKEGKWDDLQEAYKEARDIGYAQVLLKRIEVCKLPISFSNSALLALTSFTKVIGGIVVILIDCLNKFEGEEITANKLCEVYPNGFYDEASFTDYIDNYLKPRKTAWSELY